MTGSDTSMTSPGKSRAIPLLALAAAAVLAVGVSACGTTNDDTTSATTEARSTPEPAEGEQPLSPQLEQGKALFTSNCGSCHTLDAAGTQGSIGPNLDEAQVDEAEVLQVIENGGRGSGNMPADLVEGEDAQAVAAFVAASGPGS
jgi:mono/diheme cytochrome c family protein